MILPPLSGTFKRSTASLAWLLTIAPEGLPDEIIDLFVLAGYLPAA